MATSGQPTWDQAFTPLTDGQFKAIVTHEPKAYDHTDFYTSGWTLDVSGDLVQLDAEGLVAVLANTATDVRVLGMPQLVEYGEMAGEPPTYTPGNRTKLDAIAGKVAGRVLREPKAVTLFRYKGFHDVSPNGNIPSVCWDLRTCTTEFEHRTYFIARSRWKDRDVLRRLAEKVSATASSSMSRQSTVGAGPAAQHILEPPGNPPARQEPVALYGFAPINVSAGDPAWVDDATATGNGCYVDVYPCAADGSNPNVDITHRVQLPRSGRREDPNVRQGGVICYVRMAGNTYVAPSGLLDGKVGESVEIFKGAPANVRKGWALCDAGKFIVGYDAADADYSTIGNIGGFKLHGGEDGGAANNHADHVPTSVAGTGVGAGLGDAKGWLDGSWLHSETDNRPPYIVRAWIERVD